MRKDMAKVIVERPRIGSGVEKPPSWEKNVMDPDEQLPQKESMTKRHYRNRKQLNENLAPLEKFLKSKVGTHWNKVYSEICANISVDSAVQKHVRDHVWDLVEKNIVLIKNHPFRSHLYRYSGLSPLRKGDMYIHPKTGILCIVTKNIKAKKYKKSLLSAGEKETLIKLFSKFKDAYLSFNQTDTRQLTETTLNAVWWAIYSD